MSDSEASRNKYERWVMPLIAEFVGIFIFAFIHCMGAYTLPYPIPSINDGLFVTIMIISIGPISGALINPAMTIAVALGGGVRWAMVPLCIVVQLVGSICGAALAKVACGTASGYYTLAPGVDVGQGVLTEATLTILLVFATLQAGIDYDSPIAAFAVGFAAIVGGMTGAAITGGSMNPGLSFGPAVIAGVWDNYWIYWVGAMIGALIAVVLHRLALATRKNRLLFLGHSNNCDDTSIKSRDSDKNQVSPV